MHFKRIYSVLAGMMLMGGTLSAGETVSVTGGNLLSNGSFEEYSCDKNGCTFNDWSYPFGTASIETEDKLDGNVSIQIYSPSISATLDNAVSLPDAYYEIGSEFTITLHYKVVSMMQGTTVQTDCYWEPAAGGDAELMKMHDAEVLQQVVADSLTNGWESIEMVTTKPSQSARLRIRMVIPKKAKVLFDAWNVMLPSGSEDDPYIRVLPLYLSPLTTNLGQTVDFPAVHIEQGNLTGITSFEIAGKNADMFRVDVSSMPSSQADTTLLITYAPTSAGTHTAILKISNSENTTLFHSLSLTGTCIDPSLPPSISVNPDTLPLFEAVEGFEQRDTLMVKTENCYDFAYLRVEHIDGAAFTIDGSMLGKNAETPIQVRFAPTAAGEYYSKIHIYSEGVDEVVVDLHGKGIKRDSTNIDWMMQFVWDESHPLTLMNETFDSIQHNKTLILEGWQNVAYVDHRPWWGFDEAKTQPVRGDGKYAKATAYQYAQDSTGIWQMFLVTPALDYKNADGKIFAFSVMGEYMPDEDNQTGLEIYYVDATREKAYFQDLTESFGIPSTSDENGTWRTFFLDLEPYAETMADVFHMAFRYVGPNGSYGAVTYYLDDISWGRTDLPQIKVDPTFIIDSTAYVGTEKVLATVEVKGKNLNSEILLSLAGANYNRFSLSKTSLTPLGGQFDVLFEGQEEGVHEAYVVLSSSGAPDAYIPMAVLCHEPQGIETVRGDGLQVTGKKVLRDGQLYIQKNQTLYSILGIIVK